MPIARRFRVRGVVQGVGFRPHVYRLATELGLAGEVANLGAEVEVLVEGEPAALDEFSRRLALEAPPVAVVEECLASTAEPTGRSGFRIVHSRRTALQLVRVPPDLALCADCAAELTDPADRRYLHPFINCTNCGPRYTIVRGVPYDRPRTSMARFPMCESCRAEYENPTDRRYHAQPVACHWCGPTVRWMCDHGGEAVGPEALTEARMALAAGRIVAVKGIGGFHLACDAANDSAVQRLRARKRREQKPLAVMFRDMAAIERNCVLTDEARRLLTGPEAPIVLAPRAQGAGLSSLVAPDSTSFGALLPYAPIHALLFMNAPYDALVMTSGNLTDEPICTDNDEARVRLAGVADGFLLHDRDILRACDDSVVRPTRVGNMVMRRSRGFVPAPVHLSEDYGEVLAVGGHLKNTFCITSGRNAYLSQHIGDLDDATTLEFFGRQVESLIGLLEVHPRAIACDMHPTYLSTRWAEARAEEQCLPLVHVQHHHAHIAAVLAEHGQDGPVLGIACDGTGYGEDGTVWGCELLLATRGRCERVGHLLQVPLPGGEAAVREPWRMALAWAEAAGVDQPFSAMPHLAHRGDDWEILRAAARAGLNAPVASSAGRLFDAVAAMLGLCEENAYEGQAPMRLEAVAADTAESVAWGIAEGQPLVLDPRPALRSVLDMHQRGAPLDEIAGAFHNGFCSALVSAAVRLCTELSLAAVALSGGTFQNERVLVGCVEGLRSVGIKVYYPIEIPPNDGGLSLGQAVVAACRE